MKKKVVLPIIIVAVLLLTGTGIWKVLNSGLKMTAVESFETAYNKPVLVYELVKKLNHRDRVTLTLSGKGEVEQDGQAITFSKAGDYKVNIHAKDGIHTAEASTTIHVVDDVPPVLSTENFSIILGETPDYLKHVLATDEMDGDLMDRVRIDSSEVNLDEKGRYEVKYTVFDAAGNAAAATAYLTVCQVPAAYIELDSRDFWLSGNEFEQLDVVVEPQDWEGSVRWETSDPKVCSVNDGLVVWKGAGECTITATADDVSAECVVHCVEPALTTVWLNQRTLELDEHQTAKLTCKTYPSNWKGSIEWRSSNPSVATVEDGVVTWVGPGSCTIIASSNGIADQCEVSCAGKTWTDLFWELFEPSGSQREGEHDGFDGHDERKLDENPFAG